MKRILLLACAALLAAGCASGADMAEDEASPDSAVVETLAPEENVEGRQQTP